MRLTGGVDRGHPLVSPRGFDIRPTSDRVREALFSILGPVDGLRVLDIFAGAGTLGLESLSRGAALAWFVDPNPRALAALNTSLERLKYADRARVIRRESPDAVRWLETQAQSFDLIFLDPPYGSPALPPSMEALGAAGLVAQEGMVVAEHDRDDLLQTQYGQLHRVDIRHYGRTELSFYHCRRADT